MSVRHAHAARVPMVALALLAAACASDPMLTAIDPTAHISSVTPAGGASGVATTTAVVVTFSHSMMAGMEMRITLHQDSVTGAEVAGVSIWSNDRRTLTFTPAEPLAPLTTYVLHLAPDLRTAEGRMLNHAACTATGGQNVTGAMLGIGGGMHGGMGGGMMGGGMMGGGWQPVNGSYGMSFTFTTAE